MRTGWSSTGLKLQRLRFRPAGKKDMWASRDTAKLGFRTNGVDRKRQHRSRSGEPVIHSIKGEAIRRQELVHERNRKE
jgi:hypothetical protein